MNGDKLDFLLGDNPRASSTNPKAKAVPATDGRKDFAINNRIGKVSGSHSQDKLSVQSGYFSIEISNLMQRVPLLMDNLDQPRIDIDFLIAQQTPVTTPGPRQRLRR